MDKVEQENSIQSEISLSNKKLIKRLDGHSSMVELIEVDGKGYILKTADKEDVFNERMFYEVLEQNNLPSLIEFHSKDLSDNQLLLEYIPESKGIDWRNPIDVEKWGSAVRQMHGIKFDAPFKISENNEKIVLDWKQHLKNTLETAIQRQLDEQTDIPKDFLEKIRHYALSKIDDIPLSQVTLLHGDLHDGNTLIKDDKVVLYDKSSELFAGDPLYDLTIIMTHLPNGAYVRTDNPDNANDSKLLEAFIKGYGENFLEESKDLLDLYLVIRALDRYPNPFETFNKQIIENIVL